jgi:hypothetical protein
MNPFRVDIQSTVVCQSQGRKGRAKAIIDFLLYECLVMLSEKLAENPCLRGRRFSGDGLGSEKSSKSHVTDILKVIEGMLI